MRRLEFVPSPFYYYDVFKVDAPIMSQHVLWVIHTNKNGSVQYLWDLSSDKLYPLSTVFWGNSMHNYFTLKEWSSRCTIQFTFWHIKLL